MPLRGQKEGIMTKNKFAKRMSVLALALVAALLVTAIFPGIAFRASAKERSFYYTMNEKNIRCIDADATYFAMLDEADNITQMQAMVEVANAIKAFESAYSEDDYLKDEWKQMGKYFILCENACRVKDVEDDNYYLNYSAFVDANKARIAEYKDMADALTTKAGYFDNAVEAGKSFLDTKVDTMLADTILHAGAEVYEWRNMYDEGAQAEVADLLTEGKAALDALAYSGDYDASIQSIEDTRAEYADKLNNVDRNDLERAYSAIQDYDAISYGEAGNLEAAKAKADALVESAYAFYDAAKANSEIEPTSQETLDRKNEARRIVNMYTKEKAALDRYTEEEKVHDYSDIQPVATLTSEDGVVTVTAYAGGEEASVIPYNANVKIVDNSGSIYKLNAENEIVKINGNVSVAYCMDITIYKGTKKWDAVKTYEGKEVTYKVTVDLAKYYTECIQNHKTWLSAKIGLKRGQSADYSDLIKRASEKYATLENDTSLCYHYLGQSNVEGLKTKLEGDKIVFETKSFSNFCVLKAGGRGLFENPIFWFLIMLVIIFAFIAIIIIMSLVKYKITFDSKGGDDVDPVKVRYGDYFSMPKSPTKRGYTFAGWFEDEECTLRFIDTCLLKRKSFTVYAKWNTALTPEQADDIYGKLRDMLASHAAIGDSFEIEDGATVRLAKLVNEELEVKLYLALDPAVVGKEKSFAIATATGEEAEQTPLLKKIDNVEAFNEAVALINLLIDQYDLQETPIEIPDDSFNVYVLEFVSDKEAAPIEEPVEEEPVEEIEEPVEEPVEEEAPTEEELRDYFKAIRTFAKGFALAEDNGEIDKDAVIIKAFLREDCVDVYLNADVEKFGLEAGEGVIAEDTPAHIVINSDESFEEAKNVIKTVLEEMGLEESGMDVDLGESEAKSFGYKLKFEE